MCKSRESQLGDSFAAVKFDGLTQKLHTKVGAS